MKRFFFCTILALASLLAHSQNSSSSTFVGEGEDDAHALATMVSSVMEAYSYCLTGPVMMTYSDELRHSSHKGQNGKMSVRSITRTEVENLFVARRRKADQLATEADALKNTNPAKARLYYHWARAFYSSIPGDNGSIVARMEAELLELSSYPFPQTSANNIGNKAESIYAAIHAQSSSRVVSNNYVARDVHGIKESVNEPSEKTRSEGMAIVNLLPPIEVSKSPVLIEQTGSQPASFVDKMPYDRAASPIVASVGKRSRGRLLVMAGIEPTPDVAAVLSLGYQFAGAVPLGAYCSFANNFRNSLYDYTCTSDLALPDGGLLWSTGRSMNSSWSVTAGTFYTPLLSGQLGLYCGAGVGGRNVILEDVDGAKVLVTDASGSAFRFEIGTLAHAGAVSFSIGTVLGSEYVALRLGVGMLF